MWPTRVRVRFHFLCFPCVFSLRLAIDKIKRVRVCQRREGEQSRAITIRLFALSNWICYCSGKHTKMKGKAKEEEESERQRKVAKGNENLPTSASNGDDCPNIPISLTTRALSCLWTICVIVVGGNYSYGITSFLRCCYCGRCCTCTSCLCYAIDFRASQQHGENPVLCIFCSFPWSSWNCVLLLAHVCWSSETR